MRVLVTADLHLDHWGKADRDPLAAIGPVFPTLDTLIIAGDLANDPLRHCPDLWLFGHTHRHLRGRVGQTPVVDVSLGYPEDIQSGAELADILLRGLVDADAPHLGLDAAGG